MRKTKEGQTLPFTASILVFEGFVKFRKQIVTDDYRVVTEQGEISSSCSSIINRYSFEESTKIK